MTAQDWLAWRDELHQDPPEPTTVEVTHDGETLVYRRRGHLYYLGGDDARVGMTWADLEALGTPVPLGPVTA